MIRVEYEFICDNCHVQEIVTGKLGSPIRDILPYGWRHFNNNRKSGSDFCGDCKSNERDSS